MSRNPRPVPHFDWTFGMRLRRSEYKGEQGAEQAGGYDEGGGHRVRASWFRPLGIEVWVGGGRRVPVGVVGGVLTRGTSSRNSPPPK